MNMSKERFDEIVEKYSQAVVNDMDIDDMIEALVDHATQYLSDLPEPDALDTILDSVYADDILTPEEMDDLQ